jgi:hypothetical protein
VYGEKEARRMSKKRQFKIMSHLGAVKTQTFHFRSCPLKCGEYEEEKFSSLH